MIPPRHVLVGGGSGALGRAVVQAALAQGTRVAVPYRSRADWEALRSALDARDRLFGMETDLADPVSAGAFVEAAVEAGGAIDGVAALQGAFAASGPFEATSAQEWREMLRTNLDTVAHLCRAALPHLLRSGGSVVTVTSRRAESGGAGATAYAVAKMGVLALTRALAAENKDRGVRFNAVSPGIIDTAANREAMPQADRAQWTPPEAIARSVLFLLSPDSAPTTGAVVPVDGRA